MKKTHLRILLVVALIIGWVLGSLVAADLTEARPYRADGRASCYGPGLWGNHMANGQRLRRGTLGVAHKTLPFGTRVIVYNGNRRRMVLVKDRGPFTPGRTWDLTEATVRVLGVSGCRSWGVRYTKVVVVR